MSQKRKLGYQFVDLILEQCKSSVLYYSSGISASSPSTGVSASFASAVSSLIISSKHKHVVSI